ncbi:SPJ_0845 family protein [Enterococcus sp. AZ177]
MGLKFERTNDLDKLFDSFAVDPKKVELPKEELEKQTAKAEQTEQKKKEQ